MNTHTIAGFVDEVQEICKEAVSLNWVANKVKGPAHKQVLKNIKAQGGSVSAARKAGISPESVKKQMGGYPFSKKTGLTAADRKNVRKDIKALREEGRT